MGIEPTRVCFKQKDLDSHKDNKEHKEILNENRRMVVNNKQDHVSYYFFVFFVVFVGVQISTTPRGKLAYFFIPYKKINFRSKGRRDLIIR